MKSLSIDYLQSLSTSKAIQILQTSPENQWFDRKSGRVDPKQIAPLISAFANTEGGLIAVGIENKSLTPISPERINKFRREIRDIIAPIPRHDFYELEVNNAQFILLIEVVKSTEIHFTSDKEAYIRAGDSTKKLTHTQLTELEYDRGARNFEDTLSQSTLKDLDLPLLEAYANKIGAPNPERALYARGMLTKTQEAKVCALLLFSKNPQMEFPSAFVRVLSYSETDRGTGRQQSLKVGGDIRCEGPLTSQITKAVEAVRKLIPRHRILGVNGKFTNQPIIPEGAWIEGIVNAVVHRSYSISGDHIRVEIFPNRLVITSPGRFPGLADPTSPTEIIRHARNPRIARTCAELDLTQELGEGIRRIFSEMRQVGLVDPTYKQTPQNVVLTLHALDNISEEIRKVLGPAVNTLEKLRTANQPLGTGEIVNLTGQTRQTALRHLNLLRSNGLIRWEGKSANDPRATWSVI